MCFLCCLLVLVFLILFIYNVLIVYPNCSPFALSLSVANVLFYMETKTVVAGEMAQCLSHRHEDVSSDP